MSNQTSINRKSSTALAEPVLAELAAALESMNYGTIELVLHAGRVVEIVQHRRKRFQLPSEPPNI